MKKYLGFLFFIFIFLFSASLAYAQESSSPPTPPPDQFYLGQITRIANEEQQDDLGILGAPAFTQTVYIKLLEGSEEGKEITIEYGDVGNNRKLKAGEKIIIGVTAREDGENTYFIFDQYRLPALYWIIGSFFALTILFVRWRGMMSLLGLFVSIAVIMFYMIPQILAGKNALVVIIPAALVISLVSIYLAHGFSRRTSVAVGGTLITIVMALGLSLLFSYLAKLFGVGSEEAFYLQTVSTVSINLKGLLLGGIIIGVLGILDDITTAQAAAVDEIAKANPSLIPSELFRRGLSVGREHITSLVNTLVLAYAGASFPTLLLFTIYHRPVWVIMNTEPIAEEIVRTLVGSIALMCAVPITTFLASRFLYRKKESNLSTLS